MMPEIGISPARPLGGAYMSDVDAALARVDEFEANASQNVAWKLDRGQTLQRIRRLLRNPDLLHQ